MTNKADVTKLAYVGSKPGTVRDSDSWYTPSEYIEAARRALQGFGLDPFSSAKANKIVKADNYFTEDDDAFVQNWRTKRKSVWMNPPYGRGLVNKSVDKFISEYQAGNFLRGIVLVNNATDTKWFKLLLSEAKLVCFTDHRIAFTSPDGKNVSGNTRGQAFILFDDTEKRHTTFRKFKQNFRVYGTIMEVSE